MGDKNPHSFAQRCGISNSAFRRYINDGSLPRVDKLVLMAKEAGVNIAWLATGEGPMRPEESTTNPLPPPALTETTAPHQEHVTDVVNIQELLNMTAEVLTSKTVYRPALAANIKAFHRSIYLENDNQQLMNRVGRLEVERITFEERMDTERAAFELRLQSLEERLRDTEPEKKSLVA